MKNTLVFVPVFLYAVTMLIFQIKRILFQVENGVTTSFPLFFENVKNLGRSDDLYAFSHFACLNIDLVTSVVDYFY